MWKIGSTITLRNSGEKPARLRLALAGKHTLQQISEAPGRARSRIIEWMRVALEDKSAVGHRLIDELKIIWKMWQTRTAYNAELHMKNQLAHGSWVLKITPQQPA